MKLKLILAHDSNNGRADKPTRAYELAMFLTENGQRWTNYPEMQREIEQFYADKGDEGVTLPPIEVRQEDYSATYAAHGQLGYSSVHAKLHACERERAQFWQQLAKLKSDRDRHAINAVELMRQRDELLSKPSLSPEIAELVGYLREKLNGFQPWTGFIEIDSVTAKRIFDALEGKS